MLPARAAALGGVLGAARLHDIGSTLNHCHERGGSDAVHTALIAGGLMFGVGPAIAPALSPDVVLAHESHPESHNGTEHFHRVPLGSTIVQNSQAVGSRTFHDTWAA